MNKKDNDKNIKLEIIDKTDYKVICSIAEKYHMSVENFGKLLSKKVDKVIPQQIRFTVEELEYIDKKRNELNMSRSKYCRSCYMKAIEDELYMNLDIRDLKKDTYNNGSILRTERVGISFDSAETYKAMRELAEKFSLEFSSLIRYFALNVNLQDKEN